MDRKKTFAVLAALSLIAGCCIMMILYPLLKGEDIFHPEPSPEQVGSEFFAALKAADYPRAFDLCDETLQAELVDPPNLQYTIELYEYQPESWEFLTQRVSANQVELSGTMEFQQHPGGSFQLILRRSAGAWRVAVFHLDYN